MSIALMQGLQTVIPTQESLDRAYSLPLLKKALEAGESISTAGDGTWTVRSKAMRVMRRLAHLECHDDIATARFFENYLFSLEERSAPFINGIARTEPKREDLAAASKALLGRLKKHGEIKLQLRIAQLILAYGFRTTPDPSPDNIVQQAHSAWLEENVLEWKREHGPHLPSYSYLTAHDKSKIQVTALFSKFVELLIASRSLRDEYYRFVFRNCAEGGRDAPRLFIQFPHTVQALDSLHLTPCEGRLHTLFRLHEGTPKRVLIKVDGVYRTFTEVHDALRTCGRYVTERKGIVPPQNTLTPAYLISRAEKASWAHDLAPLEILSKKSVMDRFGASFDHALLVVRAARVAPKDEPISSLPDHAWIELVSPREDGQYALYAIGKVAPDWKEGRFGLLYNLLKTQRGAIRFDNGPLFTSRYHAAFALPATKEQIELFWDQIGFDLLKERVNLLQFRLLGQESCMGWVQKTIDMVFGEAKMPRFFSNYGGSYQLFKMCKEPSRENCKGAYSLTTGSLAPSHEAVPHSDSPAHAPEQ